MNRIASACGSFVLAFVTGVVLGSTIVRSLVGTTTDSAKADYSAATETPPFHPSNRLEPANSDVEFYSLSFHELGFPDSEDLIDMFSSQSTYRESEVIAKTGERWLTLFERNGKYSLKGANATVKKLNTVSYPGDEHDVQLSFDKPGVPILAVRPNLGLKSGRVTTIYHRPSDEEIGRRNLPIGSMETGFKRVFNLRDTLYTLRVSRGMDTNGNKIGVLVLERAGMQQVIATNFHEAGREIIGSLLWAGDLDGDNKLDLYFDEFNEKGAFVVGLYLSSAAGQGSLLKRVAMFSTAGC